METDANKLSDADVIALAQAERDAGVPDQQTAAAAPDAAARLSGNSDESEAEAHPS